MEMEFAKKLFEFSFVKSIYISKNYVSITKYDLKNWDEVTIELRNFIKNYLENNEKEMAKMLNADDDISGATGSMYRDAGSFIEKQMLRGLNRNRRK